MGAGPGPLEVVAAQPAGHVHHLADEIQAGLLARLQRLRREVARVDAAHGDLGLGIALGAGGRELPALQALGQPRQRLVGRLGQRALQGRVVGAEGFGQARRQPLRQFPGHQPARAGRLGLAQRGRQVDAGRQVDGERRARLPVAGDLQHRRAGQAAVGEQQVFVELRALFFFSGGDQHRQRQPGQTGVGCPGLAAEGERH